MNKWDKKRKRNGKKLNIYEQRRGRKEDEKRHQ